MPRLLFAASVLLALIASASAQTPDLIRPVSLTAGIPDTLALADVFGPSLRPDGFADTAGLTVALDRDRDTLVLSAPSGQDGLHLLRVTAGTDTLGLPVEVTTQTEHTFTFTPDVSAPSGNDVPAVFVIGAFNDWSRGKDRLADGDGDGTLSVTLPIRPGRYEYKYTVDGEEVTDVTNPDSVLNPFGAYNNLLTVRPRTDGRIVVRPTYAEPLAGFGFALHLAAVHQDETGERPIALQPSDITVLADNRPIRARCESEAACEAGRFVASDIDSIERYMGTYTVRVAVSQDGLVSPWVAIPMRNARPLGDAQAQHSEGDRESNGTSPFVWQDAILYQIMVDRFANGDPTNDAPIQADSLSAPANYHGGDFQGILDQIENGYFQRLGVNVLWLSPVYDNPNTAFREFPPPHRLYTGYHGYWPIAPRTVDEHFGDMALLQRVVDAAHDRGMKVLLDFVANHTHQDHPYFQNHRDWFGTLELPDGSLNLRRWDDYRLTTWFEPYLPSFDFTAAPEAVEQMTADAAWWLHETGADGFRHDAVKHVPNTFWRALTARLKTEVAPGRTIPLYQIGETFGSYDLISSYVTPGQLDAQFNFTLYDAAMAAFLAPDGSFANLAAELDNTRRVYGPLPLMGNLMDSHDKPRFLGLADGDIPPGANDKEIGWTDPPQVDDPASYRRAELYLAYMLTIPGIPTIYYGDEIGMTGANDPDNRRPMRFDRLTEDEARMQEATARLVHLRRDHAALRHGTFETLHTDDDLWAYLRTTPSDAVLVLLNKSTEDRALTLDLPGVYGFQTIRDGLDAGPARLDGRRTSLLVPAGGYRIAILGR